MCDIYDHVRISSISGNHNRFISSFMTYHAFVVGVTRLVPLAEQELQIIPKHKSSPPVFNGVHVAQSLVSVWRIVVLGLSFFLPFTLHVVYSFRPTVSMFLQ